MRVANLLLHEVTYRSRLHQLFRPNLAFPSGSWGPGEIHCICFIYEYKDKWFCP
jgi:hypothetical protein